MFSTRVICLGFVVMALGCKTDISKCLNEKHEICVLCVDQMRFDCLNAALNDYKNCIANGQTNCDEIKQKRETLCGTEDDVKKSVLQCPKPEPEFTPLPPYIA